MDKATEYKKLVELKKLAEELNYNSVVRIIEADDEITELYHELREDGFTDKELRNL